jgi:hypothetical protein
MVGQSKIEREREFMMKKDQEWIALNEKFTLKEQLVFNESDFQKKEMRVVVTLHFDGQVKTAGMVELDIRDFILYKREKREYQLQRCPIKNSRMELIGEVKVQERITAESENRY